MSSPNPGAVWDHLLASALRRGNTTASPSTARKLALRPEPTVYWLPHRKREIALIPDSVRATIRKLVSGEAPWPWFVFGPAGTGKTCAALCLLDHATGKYYTATEWSDLLNRAREGRVSSVDADRCPLFPEDLWKEVARAPLVVIDELGSRQQTSDHQYDAVKRILDDRWGKPTVYLSNLTLASVAQVYDDRLADRLAEGTVTHLDGESRRINKGATDAA